MAEAFASDHSFKKQNNHPSGNHSSGKNELFGLLAAVFAAAKAAGDYKKSASHHTLEQSGPAGTKFSQNIYQKTFGSL